MPMSQAQQMTPRILPVVWSIRRCWPWTRSSLTGDAALRETRHSGVGSRRSRKESTMTTHPTQNEPAVLHDSEGAVFRRVDGMHQTRYIEIFLAGREAKTGSVVAACYNPMFTETGIPASRDTAPQASVEGIDLDKLKADYGLLGASLNGPKIWTPDWAEVQRGKE